MDLEYRCGLMDQSMKENGTAIKLMDMEDWSERMEKCFILLTIFYSYEG